jgi:hypothetical protein
LAGGGGGGFIGGGGGADAFVNNGPSYTVLSTGGGGGSSYGPPGTTYIEAGASSNGVQTETPKVVISWTTATEQAVNSAAPRLSRLRMSSRAFRAATRGKASIAPGANGTRISYLDTLAADAIFRVYRKLPGVNGGHGCVAPHDGNKACTRLVLVGSFTFPGRVGTSRLRFTGRIAGHALRPGRYKLDLTAQLAGRSSRTISASFTILAPAKRAK